MRYVKVFVYVLAAYLCYLMCAITWQYIPIRSDVAFLAIKQEEVFGVSAYLQLFYVHVFSSIWVLLACFTQFSPYIIKNYPRVHRSSGYVYVLTVLLFSAPSGFFIGLYANGGFTAKLAFVLLAVLWMGTTLMALRAIRRAKIRQHQYWMWLSFSLAFSAVTLRLWKLLFVYLFAPAPMDLYRIVAWLGWLPNILLTLLFIIINYYKYEKNHSIGLNRTPAFRLPGKGTRGKR